jgi:hypothetical protein
MSLYSAAQNHRRRVGQGEGKRTKPSSSQFRCIDTIQRRKTCGWPALMMWGSSFLAAALRRIPERFLPSLDGAVPLPGRRRCVRCGRCGTQARCREVPFILLYPQLQNCHNYTVSLVRSGLRTSGDFYLQELEMPDRDPTTGPEQLHGIPGVARDHGEPTDLVREHPPEWAIRGQGAGVSSVCAANRRARLTLRG